MTIDERIEALTMNLELLSRDSEERNKRHDDFMARMDATIVELKATGAQMAALLSLHDHDLNVLLRAATYGSVAGQDHRERLERLEKRLNDLEKGNGHA